MFTLNNRFPMVSGLVPQVPQIPQLQFPVHVPTEFFMFNDTTKTLNRLSPASVQFDAFSGLAVAPVGYTAIYTYAPQVVAKPSVPSYNTSASNSTASTRKSSVSSEGPLAPVSSIESHCSDDDTKGKYQHKSKQNRITQVYNEIKDFFQSQGVYARSEQDVLRGMDTCRVHVKNFAGLNKILEILQEVHAHPKIQLKRVATPISMKNKFQMKGFIVYMKVVEESMVPFVQGIFSKYTDLYKKCDIAKTKEMTEMEKSQKSTAPAKFNKLQNHTAVLNTNFLNPNVSVNKVCGKTVTLNGLVAQRTRYNTISPAC